TRIWKRSKRRPMPRSAAEGLPAKSPIRRIGSLGDDGCRLLRRAGGLTAPLARHEFELGLIAARRVVRDLERQPALFERHEPCLPAHQVKAADPVGPLTAVAIERMLAEGPLQHGAVLRAVRNVHENWIAAARRGPLADRFSIGEN